MPQQLGTYERNFTVYCVCVDCNGCFSRELEDQFARDSIEALDAVQHGLRDASRYRSLGPRRSTLRARVEDGPFVGTEVYFTPGASGTTMLNTLHVEGIRIAVSDQGPWIWRSLQDLPTPAEMKAMLGGGEVTQVAVWVPPNVDRDRVRAALVAKGYPGCEFDESERAEPPTVVTQKLEVRTTIGRPTQRLAAKVAFNYLAYHHGAAIALNECFDGLRSFVRHDAGERSEFVTVDLEPILDKRYVLNIVTLEGDETGVRSEVSFLGRLRYCVALAKENVAGLARSGHVFDPFNRKISELARTVPQRMILYPVGS